MSFEVALSKVVETIHDKTREKWSYGWGEIVMRVEGEDKPVSAKVATMQSYEVDGDSFTFVVARVNAKNYQAIFADKNKVSDGQKI